MRTRSTAAISDIVRVTRAAAAAASGLAVAQKARAAKGQQAGSSAIPPDPASSMQAAASSVSFPQQRTYAEAAHSGSKRGATVLDNESKDVGVEPDHADSREGKRAKKQAKVAEDAEPAAAIEVEKEAAESVPAQPESHSVQRRDAGASPAGADVAVKEEIAKVKESGRYFGKVVNHYKFGHSTLEYMQWAVRFSSELEDLGLDNVVTHEYPATLLLSRARSMSEFASDAELRIAIEKQKTVYHMIVKCVPSEVTSVVITALKEHTAYHAWQALRAQYIGDERQYLQRLEEKFVNFRWKDGESFPAFETRFETLLSELELAGSAKQVHVKQHCLMRAIEQSNHKDARNNHVFDRLNNVHNIRVQMETPYREWVMALRTEAQRIQDEVNSKSQKHQRDENSAAAPEIRDVHVAESSYGQNGAMRASGSMMRFNGGRMAAGNAGRSMRNFPCRQMLRNGFCSFGNGCKFSHDMSQPAGPMRQRAWNGESRIGNNGNRRDDHCFEFARTGRCRRGAACRFKHAAAQGASAPTTLESDAPAYVAEIYQAADSSSAGGHRVIFDSGASTHLTPCRDFIRKLQPLGTPLLLKGAFGQIVRATHKGMGCVKIGQRLLELDEIIYCPDLQDTLLSLGALLRSGHKVKMEGEEGEFIDRSQRFAIPLKFHRGILTADQNQQYGSETKAEGAEANVTTRAQYQQQTQQSGASNRPSPTVPCGTQQGDAERSGMSADAARRLERTLHYQCGHLGDRKLAELISSGAAEGLPPGIHTCHRTQLVAGCNACIMAKMCRTKFGEELKHEVEKSNDKAVADVWGPFRERQKDGTMVKYFVSLITDVYTRHVHCRIILRKKHASDHVISYMHQSKIVTGKDLKHLHTDGGKEYNKGEKALELRGVKVTRTPVYTPQHNGIAERKNRTIFDMARALLCHANLDSDHYWRYALETAIFTHNRVTVVRPHKKTQHELWTGHKPNLSGLRVFGCDAFVRVADSKPNSKLEPRAEMGTFVGYDSKRELCWKVRLSDGREVISRDVRFREEEFTVGRDPQKLQSQLEREDTEARNGSMADLSESDSEPDEGISLQQEGSSSSSSSNSKRKRDVSNSESDRDSESDSDSSSDSESDEGDSVDKRTLQRIAAAERRERIATLEQQQKVAGERRSQRQKKRAKSSGLDLDDFGHLAFLMEPAPGQQRQPATRIATNHPNLSATASLPSGVIRASDVSIPNTLREAANGPFASQWQAAVSAELDSIKSHGTYVLVDRPSSDVNIVSNRWVFAVKEKDGWVVRFKARLVARGFSQKYGVDYEETYSPVLKYTTLRVLLALTVIWDLTLELMDVQTAYLNAPLKETVYMAQPEGFEVGGKDKVCLLRKAIYGLKQAGREWNAHLDEFVQSLGFTRCNTDSCVYVKESQSGRLMILSTYVDDIPSAFDERDRDEWEEIKKGFEEKYKIKFLGEADWLLNMRIIRDRANKRLYLQQRAYVESLLEEMHMNECRTVSHPGAQEELSREDCPTSAAEVAFMRRIPYRRVVGLLTYLCRTSRPDIAHSVRIVAQYSENPGAKHWRAVLSILRYLSGTKEYALIFDGNQSQRAKPCAASGEQSNPSRQSAIRTLSSSSFSQPPLATLSLTAYADASWGSCKDTRRSTTGWLLRLGNCWIDWCSEKQETVALSSCEAEYMALTSATKSVLWARNLLAELRFGVSACGGASQSSSICCIYSDNKSAIAMGTNDVHHKRSKHIDIKHHFIRDEIKSQRVKLQWVPTGEQVADILTKALPAPTFIRFRDILVHPTPSDQSPKSLRQ